MLGGDHFDGRWQHQPVGDGVFEVVFALQRQPSPEVMRTIRAFLQEGFKDTGWYPQSCRHVRYTIRLVLRRRAAMRE